VARSGLLPQAGGGTSETRRRYNLPAQLGLPFQGFPEHVGPFYTPQFGVGVNAPLFDLTLWRRYQGSKLGIDASRAEERTAREQSVLLVVSQYLGTQRALAEVAAAHSRVDLAQALYDQAADLQKNGVGTGIDTLRANVQLQNEKQRLIVARTQLETSLFALARLLNVDPQRKVELADGTSFFETPAVSMDQTLDQAYTARPELKQLASEQARAELNLKAAVEVRLPRLSFSGFWVEQGLTPSTVIPVYQYQASIDVPLFTGGRIQAEQANDLAVRWNCKAGKCGSCSAEVNGMPKLMCMTRMDTLDITKPITIEPMRAFPGIRDLATDVSWNFRVKTKIKKFNPRKPDAPLFDAPLLLHGLLQGAVVMVAALGIFQLGIGDAHGEEVARCMAFVTLVIGNLGLVLTNRSMKTSAFRALTRVAAYLYEHERIDGAQFEALFDGSLVPSADVETQWRSAKSKPRSWDEIEDLVARAVATAETSTVARAAAPRPNRPKRGRASGQSRWSAVRVLLVNWWQRGSKGVDRPAD